MKLCMAGIDASAPFEEREKLSLVRGQVQAMLPRIAEQTGCAAVLLATCSRTELYLHAEGERALPDPAEALCRAAGVAAGAFVTRREGADAVRHLMHVAAGMQSQIFGDDQIVSQVKDAVALAREAKTTDAVLDTLFRRAVTAGIKRLRVQSFERPVQQPLTQKLRRHVARQIPARCVTPSARPRVAQHRVQHAVQQHILRIRRREPVRRCIKICSVRPGGLSLPPVQQAERHGQHRQSPIQSAAQRLIQPSCFHRDAPPL